MFSTSSRQPTTTGEKERHGLFVLHPSSKHANWDVEYACHCVCALLLHKLTRLSIVVIHGLGGDAYTTWTADNKQMWPRDFIPHIIPNARVMTFGYDSKPAFSPSIADIKDFALDLLNRLRNKRWSARVCQSYAN